MPHVKLTAKQEAFCQGIADGLGQADSYRAAYDAEGMKDNTIYPLASKLMKNDKVPQEYPSFVKAFRRSSFGRVKCL
jgi:hypothetical protein